MTVSSTDSPPHNLQLVIDFVNTVDIEADTDELATPADLAGWLTARSLLDSGAGAPRAAEHAQALALREALRALLLGHNGQTADAGATATLGHAAELGALSVGFGADGRPAVTARGPGVPGALAALLVPVVEASGDGSWKRVKACRAPDCQWAFYDASRNRAGRWCDMAVCGNRHKVRAYRERSGAS